MRRACTVMKKGGATVSASPDATSGGGGSGNPRPRSGELAPHGWRGGRAKGEGVGGGAAPRGARGRPSWFCALGVLVSVTSGRGERSEPRTYPHGEAGAEGRASPQGAGHRGEAGGATVSVRREVSGEGRDRRERPPPDTEQGRTVKPRAPRRLPPLSGERARWRQPIENEAGERSAPPPLEAKSAPTQAPKGGNSAIGAPFGVAGFPTRREVGGGLGAACVRVPNEPRYTHICRRRYRC